MKKIKSLLIFVLSFVALGLNAQTDRRQGAVSGVLYQLSFHIPENSSERVSGKACITFDLAKKQDVALDFQGTFSAVTVYKGNKKKGKKAQVITRNNQLVIPAKLFKGGATNRVEVDFVCRDQALARRGHVVYTQMQTEQGKGLFPCFDVAGLCAQYQTTLDVPAGWKTVAVDMKEKLAVSDYMFMAGAFNEQTATVDGRPFRALFVGSTPDKAAQITQVFDEVAQSMRWMEGYTGIGNPYKQACVVFILPSETDRLACRGSIALNEKAVFLGQNPSQEELLKRRELIARETAQIWFGGITAIDEPWARAMLAGFMASKITRSQLRKADYEMDFVSSHMRHAMALDRTEAAHPIACEMEQAQPSTWLYDHINSDKAPVMMRMLEDEMGAAVLQQGLQQCLRDHYMGRLSWEAMVDVLAQQAPSAGVRQFCEVWTKQKGMPVINVSYQNGQVVVKQTDPYGRGLCWRQKFEIKVVSNLGSSQVIKVDMVQPTMTYKVKGGVPAYIIPNQDGRGYGRFVLDSHYAQILPMRLIITRNDLNRYTLLNLVHDHYLQGRLAPSHFGELFRFLGREKNPLIMETAIDQMHKIASDLTMKQRYTLELVIMDLLGENRTKDCRRLVLRKLGTSAISPEVLDRLQTILDRHQEAVLDEHDYMDIAYRLAVTRPNRRQQILEQTRQWLMSAGQQALCQEFDFVSKATHPDAKVRQEVFQSLLKPENRVHEAWALKALRLLNSDVFEAQSYSYIAQGLQVLPELQQTNSLSFPMRWTHTLIAPHRSAEAKREIQTFLKTHGNFPSSLKNYIFESSWVLLNQRVNP